MAKVLVTGGNGLLGKQLTPRLIKAGHEVRVMSRKPALQNLSGFEWATAHLDTGEGLEPAVKGIDVVIHAATGGLLPQHVDVEGTQRLIDAAKAAGVGLVTYVSIVGIDLMPLGKFHYYQAKLAAEKMIEKSGIPYTIIRETQFYYLVEMAFLGVLGRLPVAFVPGDFKFQAMDPGEAADAIVAQGLGRPAGLLPDVGGPEVLTLRQMTATYLAVRGLRRLVLPMLTWGSFAAGLKLGQNTAPDHAVGKITWAEWLAEKYGKKISIQESVIGA